MNRYAPELALIAGGILGGGVGGFVLVSLGDPAAAIVATVVCWYPFGAYAVRTSDSPTGVLPPRLLTIIAGGTSVVVWGEIVRQQPPTIDTVVFGWLLALVVFLPVAGYASSYGTPPASLKPRVVVVVTTLGAVGLLAVGTVAATGPAAISALFVFLAGWLFYVGGVQPAQQRRRNTLLGGLVVAAGLVVVAGGTTEAAEPLVAAALVAAFGPLFGYLLTTAPR